MQSKTMQLCLIAIAAVLLIFLVASAAAVLLDVNLPYVTEVISAITGNTGIGAARNAFVDGPIRRENAATAPEATGYGPPPQA